MRIIITLILLSYLSIITAQNGVAIFNNGESAALLNSNVAANNVSASFINPAGMVYTKKLYTSIGVQQSFFVENLYYSNLGFSASLGKIHSIGAQLRYGGSSLLNEIQFVPSYAIQLADNTSLGIQLIGTMHTAPERDKYYSGTFLLGMQTSLSKQFSIGVTTFNPIGFFRDKYQEALTHYFQMGMGYYPSEKLSLYLSGTLSEDFPLQLAGGIHYNLIKNIYLNISAATRPAVIGIGLTIPLSGQVNLDLAGTQHLQLGFSPALNISYEK